MTLQLEYACTESEMKEAQSLDLHRRCGGGPKWRSSLLFYGFVAVIAVLLYFRFKLEIAPKHRLWFIVLTVVVFVAFLFFKRKTRKKADGLARLEISEKGLVFGGGDSQTTMPWSAFSACLESPSLFVLLDRTKTVLYAVPKRVFPDDSSRNWFRSLANQPPGVASAAASELIMPGRFAGKGVTLTVQLKYRDYLTRMLTSWRIKGIALGVIAFVTGTFLYAAANPSPVAVNSPLKAFLIMVAVLTPMLVVVFFIVALVSWRSEKKFLAPQHVGLSSEGIQFSGSDASGVLPWTTYRYYLENRWAFFVWHTRGSLWMIFPKRQFASLSDVEQCRTLLRTHLKASRWFYM